MKFFWFLIWFCVVCCLLGLVRIKLLFVSEGNFFCRIFLKILFFKFKIFSNFGNDKPVAKKAEVKVSKKKTKSKKKNKTKKKQPFFQKLNFLGLLVEPTVNLLKFLNRGLKIRHIVLNFKLASEDAHKTAVFYGNFCSFLYGFLGFLSLICKLEIDKIKIIPNFSSEESEYVSRFCIQICFGRLFIGLFKYILTIIMKIYISKMKQNSKI